MGYYSKEYVTALRRFCTKYALIARANGRIRNRCHFTRREKKNFEHSIRGLANEAAYLVDAKERMDVHDKLAFMNTPKFLRFEFHDGEIIGDIHEAKEDMLALLSKPQCEENRMGYEVATLVLCCIEVKETTKFMTLHEKIERFFDPVISIFRRIISYLYIDEEAAEVDDD